MPHARRSRMFRSVLRSGSWVHGWIGAECAITACLVGVVLMTTSGCSRCSGKAKPEPDPTAASQGANSQRSDASQRDPAVLSLLSANSKECLACAETHCGDKIDLCQQITGKAEAGPAQGQSRRQLCLDTLECTIKSRCVGKISAMSCYCGGHNIDECLAGKSDGACKSRIEKGHESTDPNTIATDWYDEKTGGSAAMGLVMCLVNKSCEMCF